MEGRFESMSSLLTIAGVTIIVVSLLNQAALKAHYGKSWDRIVWVGLIMAVLGGFLYQMNHDGCSTSWGTHGSYDDC